MTQSDQGAYVLCEDLFKIYKIADLEVVALRGLDLAVQRGEVVEWSIGVPRLRWSQRRWPGPPPDEWQGGRGVPA